MFPKLFGKKLLTNILKIKTDSGQKLIRRLIQALVVLAIFLMAIGNIAPENDIYWQIKIGESIWEDHHFPTVDIYNLTNPNAVWTLEEWTVEVIFYVLLKHFGWGSLIIFKATVIALTFAILMVILNKLKINLYFSLLVLVLAIMVNTRGYWSVFPSIFEYFFLVLAVYLMEQYRSGKLRYLPVFIPLFSLIWANSHASFFLLEGVIMSYVLGSTAVYFLRQKGFVIEPVGGILSRGQMKAMSTASAIGLLMPLASPNFYNTWIYPFIISTSKFSTTYVNEYISFFSYIKFFENSTLVSFSVVLFLLTSTLFLAAKRKVNPIDLLVFALFAYLAFRAFRHLAIFSLVALPIIARYAAIWFREYRGWLGRSLVKDIIVAVLVVSFVFWYKTKNVPFGLTIDMSGFPVEAAEFVAGNKISQNMFNHYNYGGFLIWKMPGYKVFIDGRLEMYLGQAGEDYLILLEARPGWEKIIEKYQVNFFLNYAATQITKELLTRDDWRLVFFDDQYVVFVKNSPTNAEVIEKYYSQDLVQTYKTAYFEALSKKSSVELNEEGLAAVRGGDLNLAANRFEQAVFLDSSNLVAIINLGQAYLDLGRHREALEAFKLALLIDSQNSYAKKRMDYINKILKI